MNEFHIVCKYTNFARLFKRWFLEFMKTLNVIELIFLYFWKVQHLVYPSSTPQKTYSIKKNGCVVSLKYIWVLCDIEIDIIQQWKCRFPFIGLISPGVSVPVQVPGQTNDLNMTSNYWTRLQWRYAAAIDSMDTPWLPSLLANTKPNANGAVGVTWPGSDAAREMRCMSRHSSRQLCTGQIFFPSWICFTPSRKN